MQHFWCNVLWSTGQKSNFRWRFNHLSTSLCWRYYSTRLLKKSMQHRSNTLCRGPSITFHSSNRPRWLLWFTFVELEEIFWGGLRAAIVTPQLPLQTRSWRSACVLFKCDVFFPLCYQQERRSAPRSMLSSETVRRRNTTTARPAANPAAGTQNGQQKESKQDVSVWGTSCTDWRHQRGEHQSRQEAFATVACSLVFLERRRGTVESAVHVEKAVTRKTLMKCLNYGLTHLGVFSFFTLLKKKVNHHFRSQNIDGFIWMHSLHIQSVELCTSHHVVSTSLTHKNWLTWQLNQAKRGDAPAVQNMAVKHVLGSKGHTQLYRTFEKRKCPFRSITLGIGERNKCFFISERWCGFDREGKGGDNSRLNHSTGNPQRS